MIEFDTTQYTAEAIMKLPAATYLEDALNSLITGEIPDRPVEEARELLADFQRRMHNPQFKRIIEGSEDFVANYPNSKLTHRQVIEEIANMVCGAAI